MVLCYVDNVLAISTDIMKTIDDIKQVFELKGDKVEPPDMYLGASLQTVVTASGKTCLEMSSEKYVRTLVINVQERLSKSERRLPSKCDTPMANTYNPYEDVSKELNAYGLKAYQSMIGILRWVVEIGRIDILLEVSLLSSHLALPRVGHLLAVYRIFGYLNAGCSLICRSHKFWRITSRSLTGRTSIVMRKKIFRWTRLSQGGSQFPRIFSWTPVMQETRSPGGR